MTDKVEQFRQAAQRFHDKAQRILEEPRHAPLIRTTPTLTGETMNTNETRSWSVNHPDYDKPTTGMRPVAEAGPFKITVGDLTANMIGETTIRIEHEGATIEGILTDLVIDAETTALQSFDHKVPRAIVYRVGIDVTIGSITLESLTREHFAEIVR